MIEEIIEGVLEKFESKIFGDSMHNLEIDLKRVPMLPQRDLRAFQKYLGSFVVTERGYLLRGYDERLWKKNAVIYDTETIPPQIHYENGDTDQIIHDALPPGLRLLGLKQLYESKREKTFVRVCLA